MSFISYSQNLEDVMLYRALKDVEHGFYIDVGANHPVNDSMTKAFYDHGWRGINIEPIPQYYQLLQQERQEDVNLNVAVGARNGQEMFYEVVNTGMSTNVKSYADIYTKSGREIKSYTVPCMTLNTICSSNNVSTVHFMSIDVEGSEKAVLQGFGFNKVRPWIVVIEANAPASTQDVSQEWEQIILNKDYEFVYYDGLNRFYIAKEHSNLRTHFSVPPNFFDDYITYRYLAEQNQRVMLEHELSNAHGQRDKLEEEREKLELERQKLELEREGLERGRDSIERERERLEQEREKLEEARKILEERRGKPAPEPWLPWQERRKPDPEKIKLEITLRNVYASWSWRLSYPLRVAGRILFFFTGLVSKIIRR